MARARDGAGGDGRGEDGWPHDDQLGGYDFREHIGRDEGFGFADAEEAAERAGEARRAADDPRGRGAEGLMRRLRAFTRSGAGRLTIVVVAFAVLSLPFLAPSLLRDDGGHHAGVPHGRAAWARTINAATLTRPSTTGAMDHRASGLVPPFHRDHVAPVCDVAMPCSPGFPVGLVATSVVPVERRDLGDLLGRRLGLPGGMATIASAVQSPVTVRLWRTTVDASGTVVPAAPRTTAMAVVAARFLAALLCAAGIWFVFDALSRQRLGHGPATLMRRVSSGVAFAWVALSASQHGAVHLAVVVAVVASFLSSPLTRLRLAALAVAALCARSLLGTPLVPPAPSLAPFYGPLGAQAWDFVGTGCLGAACLVVAMRDWRNMGPVAHAPSPVREARGVGHG